MLTVVTLNTWKGDGHYRRRLAAMAAGLAGLDPDIVLLQECLAAPAAGFDTAGYLADRLAMRQASWAGRRKRRLVEGVERDSTSGVTVLSRHPIRAMTILPLPSDPRDGARAAVIASIDHPDGAIDVVSLHLTHLADATLRRTQMGEIVTALPGAAILGGDFNAEAQDFAGLPLEDCRTLAGIAPSSTVLGGGCIDHIMIHGACRLRVDALETVLDSPHGGDLPSDHFGVMARFYVSKVFDSQAPTSPAT